MNRRGAESAKSIPNLPEDARKEAEDRGYLHLLECFVDGFADTHKKKFRYKMDRITRNGYLNLIVGSAAVVNIKIRGKGDIGDIPPSGPGKLVVGVALGKEGHRTAYGEVLGMAQPDLSKFDIIPKGENTKPERKNNRTFICLYSEQDVRRFFF